MIDITEQEIMRLWPKKWTEPLVSIRCLAYNHEKFIAQALDSFLMQETKFPFEIIVHDDASTDSTADIIRKYEKRYPKIIKPIYENENQYLKNYDALKRLINAKCKGKYWAYCEGDDYWISPLKLQAQVDVLEENDDVSMIHTNFICVDEYGKTIARQNYDNFTELSKKEDGLVSLFKKNHIMTLSIVLRRDVINSSVYQKSPKRFDYTIFFSAAFCGKIKYLPQKMGAYRKHSSSLMQSNALMVSSELRKVYLYFAGCFLNSNIDLSWKDSLSVNFQIMTHVIIYKNIRFFIRIIKGNPLKILLFPFAFSYAVYQRLFV